MPVPELLISVTETLRSLATIREQVRKFAQASGLKPGAVDDVELAADEAVTNVIRHAYPAGRPARLEVHGRVQPGRVIIAVRDFGRKYIPKPVTEALLKKVLATHQCHGLGRYIMKKCMDSVRYHSVPRKYNETVMVKKIK
jgi:serine/threonine-protein kinase RsbW